MKKVITNVTVTTECEDAAIHSENCEQISVFSDDENNVVPAVNWQGTAYLVVGDYSNITSSNNLFPDSPKVTNIKGPGMIQARIVDKNGKQIGRVKTIAVGNTVIMDQIPALSGTYTLQGLAINTNGNYTIKIT